MESEEGNEKTRKRMASVIASIAAVCVMTGGIGYQVAVSEHRRTARKVV